MGMKMRKKWMLWKRLMALLIAVTVLAPAVPAVRTYASSVSVYTDKISRGKTGKSMTVSFTIENDGGGKLEHVYIAFDTSGGEIWDEGEEDMKYGYSFPFEVTGSLNDWNHPKSVGSLDGKKTDSLTGRGRSDLTEGYYKVPVVVFNKDTANSDLYQVGQADLQVWISKSTGSDSDDEDETKTYDFVLGEGQSTPDGTYPHVMNFSINLRNNSPATVYNVKASMTLDPDI